MATRRSKTSRAAEDLVASLLTFASGAIKGQARINAKDASAYKAGKWGPGDSTSSSGKSSGEETNKMLSGFISKLLTMLAPAAVLATILASQASGMTVFFNSVKILGNTLGSVLLPVTMLGSAAILTLADTINANLLPNLEKWYTFILTEGVGLIDKLDVAIVGMINDMNRGSLLYNDMVSILIASMSILHRTIRQFAGGIGGTIQTFTHGHDPISGGLLKTSKAAGMYENLMNGALEANIKNRNEAKPGDISGKFKALMGGLVGPNGQPLSGGMGGIGEDFRKNLTMAMKEMRNSTSPTPQSMGLSDLSKNAQLSALQMSPFEQKSLEFMTKILDSLERANAKLQPPTTQ